MEKLFAEISTALEASLGKHVGVLYNTLGAIALFVMVAALIYGVVNNGDDLFLVFKSFVAIVVVALALRNFWPWVQQVHEAFHQVGKDAGYGSHDICQVFSDINSHITEQKKDDGIFDKGWGLLSGDERYSIGAIILGLVVKILSAIAAFFRGLAYLIQSLVLLINSALAPIFIPMLLVNSFRGIGFNYILTTLGILSWPLGWAVADIVSNAIVDWMLSDGDIVMNGDKYNVGKDKLLVVLLHFLYLIPWVIITTIIAPVLMSRTIKTGGDIAGSLMKGFGRVGVESIKGGISGGVSGGMAGAAVGGPVAIAAGVAAGSIGGAAKGGMKEAISQSGAVGGGASSPSRSGSSSMSKGPNSDGGGAPERPEPPSSGGGGTDAAPKHGGSSTAAKGGSATQKNQSTSQAKPPGGSSGGKKSVSGSSNVVAFRPRPSGAGSSSGARPAAGKGGNNVVSMKAWKTTKRIHPVKKR